MAGAGEGEHDALLSRLEREYEMMVKLAHDHDDDEHDGDGTATEEGRRSDHDGVWAGEGVRDDGQAGP